MKKKKKLMKNKLNKSLNRDKKILKIITDLYPQRIKKRFIFKVHLGQKKLYYQNQLDTKKIHNLKYNSSFKWYINYF